MRIIHLLPKLFPFGAYSLLSELHFAIAQYHPDVHQEVMCETRQDLPMHFCLPVRCARIQTISPDDIVLFYKLSSTPCDKYLSELKAKAITICVSYTQNYSTTIGASNNIVAVSSSIANQIAATIHTAAKITVIQNGVNQSRYDAIEPFLQDRLKDYFVTGRLNNFNKCKHPADWIKYVSGLNIGKKIWHDYLGDGPCYKHSQLENKRWVGKNVINLPGCITDFVKKVSYIKRWSLCLYEIPGKEGISMSLLEALACGVPALINNKPGNNEIVENGVNGWVCNNREQMTQKIRELAHEPEMLKQIQQSTKSHFAKYLDAKYMAQKYIDLAKHTQENK